MIKDAQGRAFEYTPVKKPLQSTSISREAYNVAIDGMADLCRENAQLRARIAELEASSRRVAPRAEQSSDADVVDARFMSLVADEEKRTGLPKAECMSRVHTRLLGHDAEPISAPATKLPTNVADFDREVEKTIELARHAGVTLSRGDAEARTHARLFQTMVRQ